MKAGPQISICLEEVTKKGLTVRWPESEEGNGIKSDPLCYDANEIITRNCVNNTWIPSKDDVRPCYETLIISDLGRIASLCPPSFEKISDNNTDYCYQVDRTSSWNYPCLQRGGASVITQLSDYDVKSILNSLKEMNISRYFWLPARRSRLFSPIVWFTPGQMWGREVESYNILEMQSSVFKNCLLLDIEMELITTELCLMEYPSLCFYTNNIHYPANCPENYHGVRFTTDASICFGIETSSENLSFEEFLNDSCTPMGDGMDSDLSRYVYKELANKYDLADNEWCWFSTSYYDLRDPGDLGILKPLLSDFRVSVNDLGSLKLTRKSLDTKLNCMACRTRMFYEEPQLDFKYNEIDSKIYLTIYNPTGLWKYHINDTGVQCFSDAKGFVQVIDVNELPFIEIKDNSLSISPNVSLVVEKIVYIIELITERSAQYWCEGHSKNFSLITTDKIIVNPRGNDVHVFSLAIKVFLSNTDVQNELDSKMLELRKNITFIFNADKVLLMEILDYASQKLLVLLHLHILIENIHQDKGENIRVAYERLENIAKSELYKHNYTFVNISSSMYCLPSTSIANGMTLEWELTMIGHITAPKQFCLQANGLPVKRRCLGSYILGSDWGPIEGVCNQNYSPTSTTTFLYEFLKGRIPENLTFRFLTVGLGQALKDVRLLIPADIYYLSISLKHILSMAQKNESSIDMGSLSHTAWIMDRIMLLENAYLRLAQTLNSTNVILDAIGGIIEMLAQKDAPGLVTTYNEPYEIAVQPHFIIQICHPLKNNISGIAIQHGKNSSSFMDMEVIPLYRNTTFDHVLQIKNLEIATWIPENVINTLKYLKNNIDTNTSMEKDIQIIINIFHSDAVFQALDPTNYFVNSRIIGISIPGYLTNLDFPIPIIFKDIINTNYKRTCGYWDFDVHKIIPGFWSNKGCYLLQTINKTSICKCYHLTHFGQLINIREHDNSDEDPRNKINTVPLNIISLIGSFLSLLGIVGIWITAFVFHAWRKKAGTKVLLHLTAAIALPLLLIIIFNLDDSIFNEKDGTFYMHDNKKTLCIFLGALLHYSVLASFMWMLITATLQFTRYVRVLGVLRPSRFMIKFTLVGWGMPLIPVAIILILDKENYIPNLPMTRNEYAICYPTGFFLIVSVIVPICIVLLINIVLFISVIYAISHGPDGKMRANDIDLIGAQLRLSIFLFFLLGLTWIFGIFSFTTNLIWSYFFCLTSTLQGFVLFVYFVICDPITRNLWVTLMKPQFRGNTPRESITSLSST
ncbi:uncharacterized protein LOC119829334 [Zerene cesonia]|uniref:uncharacterized protein LOC119829334 n=1 Tax=Zerene cesonia TaxID=33412 RepID=UPI0018E5A230|nr:uncharacterized protein LOC119829334 [Zerene cesonia]